MTRINITLILYFIVLLVVALAKNSRGIFAIAVLMLALTALVLFCLGYITISRNQLFRAFLIGIPAVLVLMIASDLAVAMVLVRGERDSVIGLELVRLSVEAFFDREAISVYKKSISMMLAGEYNETYISNPFFARLITVKFDDNMIHYSGLMKDGSARQLLDVSIDKIIAFLPTPVINFMNLEISKDALFFSMGDYMYWLASGVGLGEFKVGSQTSYGLALMGPMFYVAAGIGAPFIFLAIDSFLHRSNFRVKCSPIIMISIVTVFYIFLGDSPLNIIGFFVRSLPQTILVYILLRALCGAVLPKPAGAKFH